MAGVKITQLPPAVSLSGQEQMEAVQAGTSVKLTVQQIAQLANSTVSGLVQTAVNAAATSQAWAEGNQPGGEGTNSSKGWALASAASASSAALSSASAGINSGRLEVASFSQLSTVFGYTTAGGRRQVAAGDLVRVIDINSTYTVASSTATNANLDFTSTGGVKLYVLPADNGINAAAFGLVGDGVADDTVTFQAFMNAACAFGQGVVVGAKRIKITSPISSTFGDSGVSIDFGGSTILPVWTLGVNQRKDVLTLNGVTYRQNATVSIRGLRIDASGVPYFESTTPTDLRGISGLIILRAACVQIIDYEANDIFFGYGIMVRFFSRLFINCVEMVNVGSKYQPSVDSTSTYDYAGDGVYLGDVQGNGLSVIQNLSTSSYPTKIGRAGIVMEDLTGSTTSHVLHATNVTLNNYQRSIHQEDNGKGRCIWEGGSTSGFSNALFNAYGGTDGICYYLVKNVKFTVGPGVISYGGVTGLSNFLSGGFSDLEACQITYQMSVAENGVYVLRDCDVSIGANTVTWVYGSTSTMSLVNTKVSVTTGGYYSATYGELKVDGCTFSGPSDSIGQPIRLLSRRVPARISNSRFFNAFCVFVNMDLASNVQMIGNKFTFGSGLTTGQTVFNTLYNSRIDYRSCVFEAQGIWLRIYGDGGVHNMFYNCTFYNVQIQAVNSSSADGTGIMHVAGCKFVYDDAYATTAPITTFAPIGAMMSCSFVDKTTAQNIANPTNSTTFKTVGTGNVMVKNAATTVL
jgi:hypothetical protein